MAFQWGILGAARIARALIPAIREAGGEVAMLGCRDRERGAAFAREWNIPRVGSYDDLLSAELDAVYNPLPNDLHLPWSARMLEGGRHVLCEKPFTLNAGQARELADVAGRSGRTVLEAFAYRFTPRVQEAARLVRAGELGEVRAYRGAQGFTLRNPGDFRWRPGQGGGALYDVGCYVVSLSRLLLGEPGSAVAQARWSEGGVDMGLSGVLDHGGALASIECGFDWLGQEVASRCVLVGSEAELVLDEAYHNTPGPSVLRVGDESRSFPLANGYARMVAHFQRAALGEEALLYPPSDAVAQAGAMDALLLSAREGRRVAVEAGG